MTTATAAQGSPFDWVTVFAGEPWRVALLEGDLASAGILTWVPDRIIKTIDPFITGANAFDHRLQVPSSQCAESRELIVEAVQRASAPLALSEEETWMSRKNAEGRRLRWASLFPVSSIMVPWLAFRYFSGLRGQPQMPAGHAFTICATIYSVVSLFSLVLFFGSGS